MSAWACARAGDVAGLQRLATGGCDWEARGPAHGLSALHCAVLGPNAAAFLAPERGGAPRPGPAARRPAPRGEAPPRSGAPGSFAAPLPGAEAAVRCLLGAGRGAFADGADPRGRTPLMLAAALGDGRCCALLLRAGARAGAADRDGNAPLHYAYAFGGGGGGRGRGVDGPLVLLLAAGANPAAVNHRLESPKDVMGRGQALTRALARAHFRGGAAAGLRDVTAFSATAAPEPKSGFPGNDFCAGPRDTRPAMRGDDDEYGDDFD